MSVCLFQDINEMVHTERPDWQSVMTYVTAIYKYFETWLHRLPRPSPAAQSEPHWPSWALSNNPTARSTLPYSLPMHHSSTVMLQVCPRYLTTLTADQDFAGQVPHPHTAAKETLVWSCSPGACLFVYHYTRKPWEGQDVNTCGSSFPQIHAWSSSVKKKPSLSAFYLDWSCIRFSALHPFSRL